MPLIALGKPYLRPYRFTAPADPSSPVRMPAAPRCSGGNESRTRATVAASSGQPSSILKLWCVPSAIRHHVELMGASGSVRQATQTPALTNVYQVLRTILFCASSLSEVI